VDLAKEAERLNADRGDRAEKKSIAQLMESLRAMMGSTMLIVLCLSFWA
jgi:hypothetical protein